MNLTIIEVNNRTNYRRFSEKKIIELKENFFKAINTLIVIKELMVGISHLLRNYETHQYLEKTEDFWK